MTQQDQEAPRLVPDPEASAFYVNSVRVLSSMFDFMFIFGQLQVTPEEEIQMKEVAKAYLSPQHAKALSEILSRKVAEYEEQFGPLPTGPVAQEESQA